MARASDLDLADSAAAVVQDDASPFASTAVQAVQAVPAVPAAKILEMDPKLSTLSSIPENSAVPVVSDSVSAAEILEKNYADTLAAVLDEYAAAAESLRKAEAEIKSLRTKLQHSERETEDAQTKANEFWLKLKQTKDQPKLVAMLECQVETLAAVSAMHEEDAHKAKQELGAATAHIAFLGSQLESLTSTK